MRLYTYYSIDECNNTKRLKKELNIYDHQGKIEYDFDRVNSILKIEDLDLEDNDVEYLIELFENLEVYPNMDINGDDDDDDDNYGYYDRDDDDY